MLCLIHTPPTSNPCLRSKDLHHDTNRALRTRGLSDNLRRHLCRDLYGKITLVRSHKNITQALPTTIAQEREATTP